ncbi:EamA family transporter [Rhodovibrionaceae bacterium A322]
MSIAAAAAAAAAFGAGDFLGGLAIRNENWRRVIAVAMGSGLLVMAGATVATSQVTTDIPLWWCLFTGLNFFIGMSLLYSALAAGMMTSVAPITAAVAIAIPALVDAVTGTPLSALTIAGLVATIVSVVLLSGVAGQKKSRAIPKQVLALALGAGTCLAFFYIGLERVEEAGGGLSGLTVVRGIALLLAIAVAMAGPKGRLLGRGNGLAFAAGILDGVANIFLLRAFESGGLAETSAVASLYPAATIFLAILFLRERPTQLQTFGLVLAIVSITLLNFG